MILITGATGTVGSNVVEQLSSRGTRVRAMTRDPAKATSGPASNVDLVKADFNDPASLRRACDGVDKAFLLTGSSSDVERQQFAFVDAAREAGVRHVVYLSQLHADADAEHRFLKYHGRVERAIERSGMRFTHLRPNLFMQGLLMFAGSVRKDNVIVAAAGDGRITAVDVRDLAEVAAAALTGNAHDNRVYSLTGPAAVSFADMAATLSRVLGRTIRYVDKSRDEMRDALVGFHMPAWQAEGLADEFEMYRRNGASEVEPGVEQALGRQPRSFEDFATDFAKAFA